MFQVKPKIFCAGTLYFERTVGVLWVVNHVAASAQNASLAVVLYEQTAGTMQLHRVIKQMPMVKSAAVAVGAEGGISPEEIELMQKGGFISVHFATNILRCETAAIYGIAALQTALMEKNIWQSKE